MSISLRNKPITLILFVCVLLAGCGDPVKTPFRAPNLSDVTANSLISFQDDFSTEGGQFDGDFSTAQFQGYRFAAPEGAEIAVSLERVSGSADPVLILYGPQRGSGVWGTAVAVSDDSGESVNSDLRTGPLATGAYLFVVTARRYPSNGRFRISLRCVGGCEAEPVCPLREICDEDVCHTGFVVDENGCATCECLDECQGDEECGPEEACLRGVCEAYCRCSNEYQPVCGVNGVTYRNQCEAGCTGVDVLARGECREDCETLECNLECRNGYVRDTSGCEQCECLDPCAACDHLQEPICTRNDRTYTNRCQAECRGETVAYAGECREDCPDIGCELDCPNGYVRDDDGCATCRCQEGGCADDTGQVCGANAVTYSNECEARAAGVEVVFGGGPCPSTCAGDADSPAVTSGAFTCPDGYECVSGVHGLPDCAPGDDGCIALCVEKEESCDALSLASTCPESEECGSDGICESRCDCTDVYYPVCGSDGVTYANSCVARCSGITSADSGGCCDNAVVESCDLDCEHGFAVDAASGCERCACAVNATEITSCTCDGSVVNPVCGTDDVWYCNECLARCAGVRASDTDRACASDTTVDPRRACGG